MASPSSEIGPFPPSAERRPYGTARGERKRFRIEASLKKAAKSSEEPIRYVEAPASGEEAAVRWDAFHSSHSAFFKDRHVLRTLFPELVGTESRANPRAHVPPLTQQDIRERPTQTLLEAGCGSGSALFPLLRANPSLYAFAFDFSVVAVDRVKKNPEYNERRVRAFVADLERPESYWGQIGGKGVDYVTLCWTLSAVRKEYMKRAIQGVCSVLRDGGLLCFRDYAAGDMREGRFEECGSGIGREEWGRGFVRGDGTLVWFFDMEVLKRMYEEAGLKCVRCEVVEREVRNRKSGEVMHRRWIQGVLEKAGNSAG